MRREILEAFLVGFVLVGAALADGPVDPFYSFNTMQTAFSNNWTDLQPASSFAWANATADANGVNNLNSVDKGNFTMAGAIASTFAVNDHRDPWTNASEASFSISATSNKAFDIKTPSVGTLLLDGTNAANNTAFAETSGKSYAQGLFRAITFSAGESITSATNDGGATSVANAFSTSNADWHVPASPPLPP